MKNVIISENDSGVVIADGVLDQTVLFVEGNYYFDRDRTHIDELKKQEKAYFCPIKKSYCDYYYFTDDRNKIMGKEIAWIYETIENPLFKHIAGKVGFYPRDGKYTSIIVADEVQDSEQSM